MTRLGLVLALTVLAAVLMSSAAQGDRRELDVTLSASTTEPVAPAAETAPQAPRTLGVVLAVSVLGIGLAVLAVGALSPRRAPKEPELDLDDDWTPALVLDDEWLTPFEPTGDTDTLDAA